MMNPRFVAIKLLNDWVEKKTFPNLALKSSLRTVASGRDRRFITALVYGVVQKKITLDHFIAQCIDRPIDQLSVDVRNALRMGVYQMFYMDIPDAAACDTTVSLFKKTRSSGFINAVLRRCAREKDTLLLLKKTDFSVRYSINKQLVDLLLEQYGKECFVSMMDEIAVPNRSIYIYHNSNVIDEGNFLRSMEKDGIALRRTSLQHLFISENGFAVDESKGYIEGWFHIVGYHSAEAAMLMPENVEAIDLCAAPGGKTFILSNRTKQKVRSCDVHPHKVELLKDSSKRLHRENIDFLCMDATVLKNEWCESADFVLCDVPCSGLGIMGKKPDIKYKEYDSADFTSTQFKILENGAAYLRNGGRLVYSTCTLDRRENDEQILRFLSKNPEFQLDTAAIPNGMKTYFPHNGEDGFFIAVLKKGNHIEH